MFNGFTLDVMNSRIMIQLVSALGSTGAQLAIDQAISQITGLPITSVYARTSTTGLWFYVGQSGPDTIILVGPLGSAAAAASFYAGYASQVISLASNANYVNDYVRNSALAIQAAISTAHFGTFARVTIAGFSAGGAVAEYLAALLSSLPVRPIVFSFGAPRPFG